MPIKDDRPGSLRTECFELQPGKAGARAARAVVDDLARDLGELYEDTRLLVSELVTAGAERLDENTAPRLELSIYKTWLNVELADKRESRNIPKRKPKSPMRLVMKAFLPASALAFSEYQKPMSR